MTATMRPMQFSPTASDGEAPATRSRPSPPPVIAPTICASRFWRRTRSFPAITSWAGRRRSSRRQTVRCAPIWTRSTSCVGARDGLLARPRRPSRRTATVLARARASPAPARGLDPERAGSRPADHSVSRRPGLRGLEPVADARRRPLDPGASRGFERARKGGRRGLRRGRAALPSHIKIFTC